MIEYNQNDITNIQISSLNKETDFFSTMNIENFYEEYFRNFYLNSTSSVELETFTNSIKYPSINFIEPPDPKKKNIELSQKKKKFKVFYYFFYKKIFFYLEKKKYSIKLVKRFI